MFHVKPKSFQQGKVELFMLDMKFIRENPEAVKENIRKKSQEDKLPRVDRAL